MPFVDSPALAITSVALKMVVWKGGTKFLSASTTWVCPPPMKDWVAVATWAVAVAVAVAAMVAATVAARWHVGNGCA